jgi:hypothetical protein
VRQPPTPGPPTAPPIWSETRRIFDVRRRTIKAIREYLEGQGFWEVEGPMLGTIQLGAPADLLVFREDPTRDLNALQTLEAVIAGGRLYPRETLEVAVGRWQQHFADPVYDKISMWLAGWLIPAR